MRKHTKLEARLLVVAMVAVMAVPLMAEAGIFDKFFDREAKEMPVRAKYDREPPLEFAAGQLGLGLTGRWQVGHLGIDVSDDTVVMEGNREVELSRLSMGQKVRVVGHRQDDGTVLATRISLVKPTSQLKLATDPGMSAEVGEMPEGTPQ